MPNIFKSNFSRKVVLLFVSLTLIFSLFIVIVPSVYRIYLQEQQVIQQKRMIDAKVQSMYLPQAIYKARYMDQLLNAQEKDVLILADAASGLIPIEQDSPLEQPAEETLAPGHEEISNLEQISESHNCSFYSQKATLSDPNALARQKEISEILMTMHSIVRRDPVIQDVFVRTIDQTEWTCPRAFGNADHYELYEFADHYYFPMTVAEWSIRWSTQFHDGIPIITVIAPIWANGKLYGVAGINLQLAIVTNQIPQYNLSDMTQMLLLDTAGNVLTVPSWVRSSELVPWISSSNDTYLNQPFPGLMANVLGDENLAKSHLIEKIKETTPVIFSVEFHNEKHYLALAPVGNKPIKMLVILPLEDVYSTLSFWGETFTANIIPIVMELLISIVGISLILSGGAYLSLRYFSAPIQEVSRSALQIATGNLSQRVPEKWDGEVLELARSFNTMANNVQRSEKELLAKKDELISTLEFQKAEFEVIRQVVALTIQVKEISRKLLDVLEICNPIVETPLSAILLVSQGKIDQTIIHQASGCCGNCIEEFTLTHASRAIHEVQLNGEVYASEWVNSETGQSIYSYTVPIMEREELVGLLQFCYDTPSGFARVRHPFLSLLTNSVAIIIENAELQEKIRDLSITEERRHMANELHDAISQSLFSLSLTEESIRYQINTQGDAMPPLEFLIEQTQRIQEEMRWLINALRPIALHRDNLCSSLERQMDSLKRLCKTLQVAYSVQGEIANVPLEIQNHLNRIAQEAISNIIRHARAQHVEVSLRITPQQVQLCIQDDGIGFDLANRLDGKKESYGIISMCSRADQINGVIQIDTAPENGTKIHVSAAIPNPNNQRETL